MGSISLIDQYKKILDKDPRSKIFAPLADAYREINKLIEAEKICLNGLENHPTYASGHLALGRIYIAQNKFTLALNSLSQAVKLSPDNLLAYQLLGDTFIQLKQAKEALRAYKMALYIDPKLEKAQRAINKLESLTADEYEPDLFEMKKIVQEPLPPPKEKINTETLSPLEKERELSFIDALLARGNIDLAQDKINSLMPLLPGDPDFAKRYQMLFPSEVATPLKPIVSREKQAWEQKRKKLKQIEKAIQLRQEQFSFEHS